VTIRKGEPWGVVAPLPDDGVEAASDAEAAAVVTDARRAGIPPPAIGLLGGDLCRTLGGTGDRARLRSEEAISVVCDVGLATVEGVEHVFVAHAVARRAWWRGRASVAMNAAWIDAWNFGPKAHPGDGVLDLFDVEVGWTQWREVQRRLPSGAHLPHHQLRTSRGTSRTWRFDRPPPVHIDGVVVGESRALSVQVWPDAMTIVV
jgi:hypothetical protein